MKKHGFAALLLSGVMLMTAAGCGGESSEDIVPQDALPYGATITLKKQAGEPTVQYDARFLPDGAVDVLLAYYDSIVAEDAARFESIQLPMYHDYQLDTVLGGEFTDADILKNTNEAMKEYFGGDYAFAMLDVTECLGKSDSSNGQNLLLLLDGLWEDAGKEGKFSDQVGTLEELKVTRYLTAAGSGENTETNCVLKDETLYLMEYQDQWYVFYS